MLLLAFLHLLILLMFFWAWKLVEQVIHSALTYQLVLIFLLDVIEIGLPFTDPIADGPTIQKANTVRIQPHFQSAS